MSTKVSDVAVGRIEFGPVSSAVTKDWPKDIVLAEKVLNTDVGHAAKEVCLCAALKMPDGYIVRGHRHDDCYITISFYKNDVGNARYDKFQMHAAIQGFLTTTGRFVDREEGARLQNVADVVSVQTKYPIIDKLFSEDLY